MNVVNVHLSVHRVGERPLICFVHAVTIFSLFAFQTFGTPSLDFDTARKSLILFSQSFPPPPPPPPPVYLSRHIDATPMINAPFNFAHCKYGTVGLGYAQFCILSSRAYFLPWVSSSSVSLSLNVSAVGMVMYGYNITI